MKVFVTVGTTEFEDLVTQFTDGKFLELLKMKGVEEITIQYGRGKVIPQSTESMKITTFGLKNTISEEMRSADVIITHAGAGSVSEALSLRKPTIVVINDKLMNNHQIEMAKKLSDLHAVTLCESPSSLYTVIAQCTFERQKDIVLDSKSDKVKIAECLEEWCGLNTKKEVCVVLGSGGHTSEMLHILTPLDEKCSNNIIRYDVIVAESDTISQTKMLSLKGKSVIHKIPRSRNVGQSYITSVFTTIYALIMSVVLTFKLKPDVLLCNGPGTCVPVVVSCWFLNLFRTKKTKLIYFESVCRVTSLSLTSKILKYFVDIFVVQWEELQQLNKKALVHHFFYSIN
ncbi:hypothetical protein EIN_246900 [Entamoeba invadens IP1]|uniref:UDP-N-acetylglucosamine transferase subunit ALG14 n=1 Tax=Entamoeba invadens IP1 TaxID=370355 RepID=A0A0A1UDW5_ENTIV|nr:hypothetical protein EIN_246900 [Entamoeba invadens IP1]ELP94796.1 hypothetical protein EIN_246900 [Entamoeba invadens IP1]|eukprot:XP_004261567.1 hypothetical protein EIN_246900 [Entamoeba invadens IP1]